VKLVRCSKPRALLLGRLFAEFEMKKETKKFDPLWSAAAARRLGRGDARSEEGDVSPPHSRKESNFFVSDEELSATATREKEELELTWARPRSLCSLFTDTDHKRRRSERP